MKKIALLLILGCWLPSFAGQVPAGFVDTLIVDGLIQPTAIEFASDGRLFIAQKQGKLLIFKNNQLLATPAIKLKVSDDKEQGLVGLAFDPDFTTNRYVYLYYTAPLKVPENRLVRFKLVGDKISTRGKKILLKGIQALGLHNGGGLQFGADKTLYVSVGDGTNAPNAQDLNSLNGKILRINRDGTVPPGNPFIGTGFRPEIWCYGLRNPWRFFIDHATQSLWIGDVGSAKAEEINIGLPGKNYGWPFSEGKSSDLRFTNPIYSYKHRRGKSEAVIGGVVYTGNAFPVKYKNAFFFGDYGRRTIRYITKTADNKVQSVGNFAKAVDGITHLTLSPSGEIYYSTIEGQVHRIKYVGGNNIAPVAKLTLDKTFGSLPLVVSFSSAGSRDPDGSSLNYNWNFGDGKTATGPSAMHTYTVAGNFPATLTVTDANQASSTASQIVFAGNRPPVVTITKPPDGFVASPGATVNFAGSAIDPEDGTIPAKDMIWGVTLHHDDHTHPWYGPKTGITQGSFTLATSGEHFEGTIFYRLSLTAIDSGDLGATQTVDINVTSN